LNFYLDTNKQKHILRNIAKITYLKQRKNELYILSFEVIIIIVINIIIVISSHKFQEKLLFFYGKKVFFVDYSSSTTVLHSKKIWM